MVKSQEQISREQMTHLQRKLDTCRNPENNPESEVYVFIYREQERKNDIFYIQKLNVLQLLDLTLQNRGPKKQQLTSTLTECMSKLTHKKPK